MKSSDGNVEMYRIKARTLLLILAVVALSPTVLAQSQESDKQAATIDPQIAATFDLPTGSSVGIGEPVIVRYFLRGSRDGSVIGTIRDRSSNPAMEIMNPISWYTINLIGPDERPVSRVASLPLKPSGGIHDLPMMLVYPGSVHSGDLLVSRLFDIHTSGAYTLSIHVNLPYIDMGPRVSRIPDDFANKISTSTTAINKDFEFHFSVSESSPTRQQAIARRLLNNYYAESDPAMREYILDSLLGLPEKCAGNTWRSLALNGDLDALDRLKVSVALCGTGTATAAEILIEMQQNPLLNFGGSSLFPMMLVKRIYVQGNPDLKSRIEAIAKERNASLAVPYGFGD